MTFVGAIDVVTLAAVLTALLTLAVGWKRALRSDAKWLLAALLGVGVLHHSSNVLEWCGLTKALDPFEDFMEILEPMLWASFLYAFLQGRTAQELRRRVRERTADLARSNVELEQFAYVASHDLQEPLRMVTSYLQLLARRYRDKLDPEADEFIGFAVDGAGRMQNLIADLLAYSRVRTHGGKPEPTDAAAVLEGVLADLQETIRQAGATVTCDELPVVMADRTQLGQLLQNLIANAIKYRRDEPPRVHVSAEPDGDRWRFAVRDNGIGIAPEYIERIFVAFERLHVRDEYPGTGIGLAICKKIVERHGGRIWAESVPGQGAVFYFTLPRKESKPP